MPLRFRKQLIADERYESAGVFDVNNDGILDIVSGAWWYEGPDLAKRHPVGEVKAIGEFYDDLLCVPLDVNGDGRTDFVTGSWWGDTLRWRENPGDPDAEWPEHDIAEINNVETARAWDLDGDGVAEIVLSCPRGPTVAFKLDVDADGKGSGSFSRYVIREDAQGHGLGCGDIAGNGRCDLVLNNGWLEAPENPWEGEWAWHPEFELVEGASIPILVVDVNGDGINDLIVGDAHDYGLDWWEQRVVNGERSWTRHPIDPFNSQYHGMQWLDLDGDGAGELLTGKRYRGHDGNDPGADDDYGIYYFKWTGESFAKQVIDYGPAHETTGLGMYFSTADLSGNGLPDIVAPGKDGLYVFWNEGL